MVALYYSPVNSSPAIVILLAYSLLASLPACYLYQIVKHLSSKQSELPDTGFIAGMVTTLLLVIEVTMVTLPDVTALSNNARLLRHILDENRYDRRVYPSTNDSSGTNVSLDFRLIAIRAFDESSEVLTTVSSIGLTWTDKRLAWSLDDVDNAPELLVLPASEIWLPEVIVTNSYDSDIFLGTRDVDVVVYRSGKVMWYFAGVYSTACPMSIARFPFDTQSCDIGFLSTKQPFIPVYLDLYQARDDVLYEKNTEWDLAEMTNYFEETEQYRIRRLFVRLTLQRKSQSRVLFEVVPVVILSVVNPCVFLLPADSGEKVSLAITIFLSFFIFLTDMDQTLPPSSTGVCVYAVFLQALVAVSAASTVVECLVLHLHSRRRPLSTPWAALLSCSRAMWRASNTRVVALQTAEPADVSDKKPHEDDVTSLADATLVTSSDGLPKDVRKWVVPVSSHTDDGVFEKEWKEVAEAVDAIAFVFFSVLLVVGWLSFALYSTGAL